MPRFPWSLVPSSGEGSNRYRRRTVLFEDLLGNGARGVPKLLPWRVRRELSIGHEHLDSAARDSLQGRRQPPHLRSSRCLPRGYVYAPFSIADNWRVRSAHEPRTKTSGEEDRFKSLG